LSWKDSDAETATVGCILKAFSAVATFTHDQECFMNLAFPQLLPPSSSAYDSSAKTRNARLFWDLFIWIRLQPSAISDQARQVFLESREAAIGVKSWQHGTDFFAHCALHLRQLCHNISHKMR
jgi:hypothetical protein